MYIKKRKSRLAERNILTHPCPFFLIPNSVFSRTWVEGENRDAWLHVPARANRPRDACTLACSVARRSAAIQQTQHQAYVPNAAATAAAAIRSRRWNNRRRRHQRCTAPPHHSIGRHRMTCVHTFGHRGCRHHDAQRQLLPSKSLACRI